MAATDRIGNTSRCLYAAQSPHVLSCVTVIADELTKLVSEMQILCQRASQSRMVAGSKQIMHLALWSLCLALCHG